ncbi:MAG: hypothetical protein WAM69_16260 [Candidatus Sulfotelmatobacter sp.]
MKEFVPLRLRTLVDEIIERNRAEELEAFGEQLKRGFMTMADFWVVRLSFWLV